MSTVPAQTWTTRRLLAWIAERFAAAQLDEHQLCAEMLMTHVLGCDRMRLYLDPDRPATAEERETLRDLVKRALAHEPVQYLTNEAWFFGLRFYVDQRCLIPRDATETMVEQVLQHFARGAETESRNLRIADIGTGSGAIAIALAKNLPTAQVIATDLSADALDVARQNAEANDVSDRIEFREGDLLAPLEGEEPFDLILSNPPYIPDDEWARVAPNVREHEPESALRGGADGFDYAGPLIEQAWAHLRPGGALLVELAASRTEEAVARALAQDTVANADVLDDLEGQPRVLVALKKS